MYAHRYVMRTVATCYVNKVMCTPPQRHMSYLVHDIVIRTCTYMIVKFILHALLYSFLLLTDPRKVPF